MSKREYYKCVEAKDEKNGEIKIIKIYRKKKISKKDKERYLCNLKQLRKLNLHHIREVEDAKYDGSDMLIIMSKYSNCLENINTVEYFKESGIKEVIKTICECISAFHVNGLIYGNIKASNVLVSNNSCYYLCDYFCNILTRNMKMEINEIFYLSPEIIRNEEITEKSDIWSIGCLIYYFLSGKRKFEGETVNEIVWKIFRNECEELDCKFSESLNPLINKLLNINPNKRLSINELKEEIESIFI